MSSCLIATESASSSAEITAINLIMNSMSLEDKEPKHQESEPESKPAGTSKAVVDDVKPEVSNKNEEPPVLADISKATGWESSEDDTL